MLTTPILTDEAQEKYQFNIPYHSFDFNLTRDDNWSTWGVIPSTILGLLNVDANTLNEITNEITFWIKEDRGSSLQGRLDRANLPRSLRQT
jgi:hypothetical protein